MYQVHRRGSEQSLYAGEPQVNKHLAKPVVLCTSPARLFMPSTLNVLAFIKQSTVAKPSRSCVLKVSYCVLFIVVVNTSDRRFWPMFCVSRLV